MKYHIKNCQDPNQGGAEASITSRYICLDKEKMVSIGPSDQVTSLYLSDSLKRSQAAQKRQDHENLSMTSSYLTVPEAFILNTTWTVDEPGQGQQR